MLAYSSCRDYAETQERKRRPVAGHMARWCDGGRTQRSRLGTLTDKAVKTAKSRVAEAALDKVYIGNEALDNVLHFEYLGSQLHGDEDDEADLYLYLYEVLGPGREDLSGQWSVWCSRLLNLP